MVFRKTEKIPLLRNQAIYQGIPATADSVSHQIGEQGNSSVLTGLHPDLHPDRIRSQSINGVDAVVEALPEKLGLKIHLTIQELLWACLGKTLKASEQRAERRAWRPRSWIDPHSVEATGCWLPAWDAYFLGTTHRKHTIMSGSE